MLFRALLSVGLQLDDGCIRIFIRLQIGSQVKVKFEVGKLLVRMVKTACGGHCDVGEFHSVFWWFGLRVLGLRSGDIQLHEEVFFDDQASAQFGEFAFEAFPAVLHGLFVEAVLGADEELAELRVAHQARTEDLPGVVAAYADAGVRAEVEPFFTDIPRRLSEAQLVISRAGASSVADISVIGRPSILIPFAAATGDHQTANARGLVDAGAAILISEGQLDANGLSAQMAAVLLDPPRAEDMARKAQAQGRPDATDRLVALVEALAS